MSKFKTILNQNYITFDKFLDIDTLLAMRPKISALIALHSNYIRPTKYNSTNLLDGTNGIPYFTEEIKTNLDKLENKEMFEELIDNDALGTYLLFEEERLTSEGSFSVTLQYIDSNSNVVQTDINSKFDFLYEWVNNQNIFENIQRVNFFVTWKDTQTLIHRDWNEDAAEPLHSLHINFSKSKSLFLIDLDTEEKIYLTGHCNWFDTRNYHGTDKVKRSCFSLRIIGKFSEQFLDKLNKSL